MVISELLDRDLKQAHNAFVEAVYNGNDAGRLTDDQLETLLELLSRIDDASEEEVMAFAMSLRPQNDTPSDSEPETVTQEDSSESSQTVTDFPEGDFMDDDDPRLVWG